MTTAFDVLELWVADGDRTRRLLADGFGFQPAGDSMAMGSITLAVRSAARDTTVARHVDRHGDTVADVGLACEDPPAVAQRASTRGLDVSITADGPRIDMTGHGTIRHTLRGRRHASGATTPAIDHVTYCLPFGTTAAIAEVYEAVLGFERVDIGDCAEVGDASRGMRSVVLGAEPDLRIVLTEPAGPNDAGQTQRFLDAHGGPGVQHVAIACADVCAMVAAMRRRGVEFVASPPGYHAEARHRLGPVRRDWEQLAALDVFADADEHGHLFQLFTRPLSDRSTYFFELIERAGARGFGARNVSALFAAVEAAAR